MAQTELNPPAQVQLELAEAEQLTQLAEVCSMAEKLHRTSAENQIRGGKILAYFHSRVPHGNWRAWLMQHFPYSSDTAERWVRKYVLAQGRKASGLTYGELEDLDEQARLNALGVDESKNRSTAFDNQLGNNQLQNAARKFCRYCRTHKPVAGCRDCAKLNVSDVKEPAREPGIDPEEPMDKISRLAECAKASWSNKLEIVAGLKVVASGDKTKCQNFIKAGFEMLAKFAKASYRPIPPPKPGQCTRCGAATILVTNGQNGRKIYLDPEPNAGQWKLEGGLAVKLHKSLRRGDEYERHAATCPKAKHKMGR